MTKPRPLTDAQTAAIVAYVSAMLFFMTTDGAGVDRLLAARRAMEAALGVALPNGQPAPATPNPFPDLL